MASWPVSVAAALGYASYLVMRQVGGPIEELMVSLVLPGLFCTAWLSHAQWYVG